MDRRTFTAGLAAGVAAMAAGAGAAQARVAARNVVLVHGAFADASGYGPVIARLQASGLNVLAVQNPLSSLVDDVAVTNRALDRMEGPTVLVGHSYGGVVISEAGEHANVSALVYLAALAPDAGENMLALAGNYPAPPGLATIIAPGGKAELSFEGYMANFAQDVPEAERRVLAVTQQPVAGDLFNNLTTKAAWKSKPCWYAVAKQDRMIDPGLERFLAQRMSATTVEVDAGHALFLTKPDEVADLIQSAARGRPA